MRNSLTLGCLAVLLVSGVLVCGVAQGSTVQMGQYCDTSGTNFSLLTKDYFSEKAGCSLNQDSLARDIPKALGLSAKTTEQIGRSTETGDSRIMDATFHAAVEEQLAQVEEDREYFRTFAEAFDDKTGARVAANPAYSQELVETAAIFESLAPVIQANWIYHDEENANSRRMLGSGAIGIFKLPKPGTSTSSLRGASDEELDQVLEKVFLTKPFLSSQKEKITAIIQHHNRAARTPTEALDLNQTFGPQALRRLLGDGAKLALLSLDKGIARYKPWLEVKSLNTLTDKQKEERRELIGELILGYEARKASAALGAIFSTNGTPTELAKTIKETLSRLELMRPGLCLLTKQFGIDTSKKAMRERLLKVGKAGLFTAAMIFGGPLGAGLALAMAANDVHEAFGPQANRCVELQNALLANHAASARVVRSREEWAALQSYQKSQVSTCVWQSALAQGLAMINLPLAAVGFAGSASAAAAKLTGELAPGPVRSTIESLQLAAGSGAVVWSGRAMAAGGSIYSGVAAAQVCMALHKQPDPRNPYGCFDSVLDAMLGLAQFAALEAHGSVVRKRQQDAELARIRELVQATGGVREDAPIREAYAAELKLLGSAEEQNKFIEFVQKIESNNPSARTRLRQRLRRVLEDWIRDPQASCVVR